MHSFDGKNLTLFFGTVFPFKTKLNLLAQTPEATVQLYKATLKGPTLSILPGNYRAMEAGKRAGYIIISNQRETFFTKFNSFSGRINNILITAP